MSAEKFARVLKLFALGTLVVFSFGAAGEICGKFFETTAAAFGSSFPDNKPDDIRDVLNRVGDVQVKSPQPENTSGVPIAVMVADEQPRAVVGWDLRTGKQLWKTATPASSELTVGGDVVVFQSGPDIVALDVRNGKKLWSYEMEAGWDYHGADADDTTVVAAVGVGGKEIGDYANGRIIAFDAHSGGIRWEHVSGGGLLGEPALYGKQVFVPWDRQKVVVLDAEEGDETCRLRGVDYTINFVEAEAGGAYFGSLPTGRSLTTLFKFNEEAAVGKREGATAFVPQLEPVPSDPGFKRNAFAAAVAGRSAAEKIRFHWRPAVAGRAVIAMVDNKFYLHYWRYVIAFDSATSQAVWTYRSNADVESMRSVPGGVVGVDSNGRFFFLDTQNGAETWSLETGAKALTAAFDADGFRPASAAASTPPDPLTGLKEMIWDKDNRMLPIRSYAAFLIAAMPAPEVTRDLLQVYSDASTPKGLRDSVVKALEKRTAGAQYLVEALHMRYDYLEQTQPPPMTVVAQTLVNMNERAAVPGLLEHLMDHETPVEFLRPIVLAIRELGDPTAVHILREFITLYHADSSLLGHEDALAGAAEAMLKYGDKATAEPFVVSIRDDAQTLPELKAMLRVLIDPEAAAREEAAAKAASEAAAKAATEAEARAQAEAEAAMRRPVALTREQINNVVVSNQLVLRPCVQAALGLVPTLQNIRLRFVVTGSNGQASDLRVLPNNVPGLQECLENGLKTLTFPLFTNMRQMATYTITIRGAAPMAGFQAAGQSAQPMDPDAFGGVSAPVAPQQPAPQPVPQSQPQPQPGADPDAF